MKIEVTVLEDSHAQKPTEKRPLSKCKNIARAEYVGEYGAKHVLVGLNKAAKKGEVREIEGRIFPMKQDALWEKEAATAPAA